MNPSLKSHLSSVLSTIAKAKEEFDIGSPEKGETLLNCAAHDIDDLIALFPVVATLAQGLAAAEVHADHDDPVEVVSTLELALKSARRALA